MHKSGRTDYTIGNARSLDAISEAHLRRNHSKNDHRRLSDDLPRHVRDDAALNFPDCPRDETRSHVGTRETYYTSHDEYASSRSEWNGVGSTRDGD